MNTPEGRIKAKQTLLAKDPNYYSKMGKKGADAYISKPEEERKPRGFEYDIEKARQGGVKSRKPKKNKKPQS